MPQVPRKTEREVLPSGAPSVSTAGGQLPGLGVGQIQQTTAIARDIIGIGIKASREQERVRREAAIKAKQDMDRVMALDADNQLAQLQNDLDLKVSGMKGKDAAGAMEVINDEWIKGAEEIEKGLFNPDQKIAFTITSGKRFTALRKSTGLHIATQLDKFSKDTYNASIKTAQDQIAVNYTDLEFVTDAFAKQKVVIEQQAIHDGRRRADQPETVWEKNEWSKAQSRSHAAMIKRMIFEGQLEAASSYEKAVRSKILNEDLRSIFTLRKEKERSDAATNDELYKAMYIRAEEGDLGMNELDNALDQNVVSVPRHGKLKRIVVDPFDDPTISTEDKVEVFRGLVNDFKELRGGKVDKTGKLLAPAKKNELEVITAFRDEVADKQRHLTKSTYRNFMLFTQRNYDEAREAKIGIWDSFINSLQNLALTPNDMYGSMIRGFAGIFGPDATPVEAKKTSDTILQAEKTKTHPIESSWEDKQIVEIQGTSWKVTKSSDGTVGLDPYKEGER